MSDRSLVCFENHQNDHKGYTNINTNHETQRFQLQRRKMTPRHFGRRIIELVEPLQKGTLLSIYTPFIDRKTVSRFFIIKIRLQNVLHIITNRLMLCLYYL